MPDILKSAEYFIKRRYSSRSINKNKGISDIVHAIEKAYSIFDNGFHSIPSAGGLYGLKIILFSENCRKTFDIHGLNTEEPFDFSLLKDSLFSISNNFSKESFFISIQYDYDLYFEKYGNCGNRYAAIECGAFLQNLQILLLEKNISGFPIGIFEDQILELDESMLYFLIN